MNLSEIQKDFIEAIFGGETNTAAKHILGDDTLTAEQRFGIYRGSVHGILTQALGLTFPVCKALVGEKFFNKMCSVFIDQYPPKTSFFAEYGNYFSRFLDNFEPVKQITYISDVARLEWARHEVWHTQTGTAFDINKLAKLTEEQQSNIVFKLSNTLRLIQSSFRIDDIWFAHQDNSNISLDKIDLNHQIKLAIWKRNKKLKILLMNENPQDALFWDFLFAVSDGKTLEELAEQFGEELPALLNQGIQSTWIQDIT